MNMPIICTYTFSLFLCQQEMSYLLFRSSIFLSLQWLEDVRLKVTLNNEEPIPVLLLANKVFKNL